MATIETAWKPSDRPVRYHADERTVELGDRIVLRGWLRRRQGVVNYVPGLSPPHDELEHDGLFWVGITLEGGRFTGVLVDPDTGRTLARLGFVARGDLAGVEPPPPAPFE